MNETFVQNEEGFEMHGLRNGAVEIRIVPELGARILSLRDRRSGREWMDRPLGKALFANVFADDFVTGTFAGADECLPTIAPLSWKGRDLPDHGEVWALAWKLDEVSLRQGILTTSVELPRSPLSFRRAISLDGEWITLDYEVTNLGTEEEPFLWALHPLIAIRQGDHLELPPEVEEVIVETASGIPKAYPGIRWAWPKPSPGVDLERLELGAEGFAKFFAGPLQSGTAALANRITGDRLEFHWDAVENPWLGIWLTRGGFRGFHHLAIEPSNGSRDALDEALQAASPEAPFSPLPPEGTSHWQVRIRLTNHPGALPS